MRKELEKVRERNEPGIYLGEAHSSREPSQCKGPGQVRAWYVEGRVGRKISEAEWYLGSTWAGEVVGVAWGGKVDPLRWCFSHFNVHLRPLGIQLKCGFWFSKSGMGPEFVANKPLAISVYRWAGDHTLRSKPTALHRLSTVRTRLPPRGLDRKTIGLVADMWPTLCYLIREGNVYTHRVQGDGGITQPSVERVLSGFSSRSFSHLMAFPLQGLPFCFAGK